MKPEPTTISVDLSGGKKLTFETGKLAKQAHGSAVVRMGDNVILATAVANADPREGIDFFPLTVDYREYTYAGGRIPGGFIKREGRRASERFLPAARSIAPFGHSSPRALSGNPSLHSCSQPTPRTTRRRRH
jgi:polyribonucleotide nucleotidyltransferase